MDDRIVGTLLAAACGDALGVAYEPSSEPRPVNGKPAMLGGGFGHYAPGEYSDDTQMAVVIARVAADGSDLRTDEALDRIAAGFVEDWYGGGATDVGAQTRSLLSQATPGGGAAQLRRIGAELHARSGRTAGNGSLMRTAPVALRYLGDANAMVDAARAVSALTHHDPVAGDGCALWCLAIDHAIRTGELDVRVGLSRIDTDGYWAARIDEAEAQPVSAFAPTSGWVVGAFQGAWSAIVSGKDLRAGIVAAVDGGGDTDTVAAIAGALLGAAYGASAVPAEWRSIVHGWPGLDADGLAQLALRCARRD
ncbi:ADP-ribosylglycohydrolase family protein [Cryptosporangium sp. NPDC048952]|uniref:ADP-ribosylglycohydrolase family protein n=1 Tax=Cryptosporangium sp. NPDC048952 TaxID=3363961 RepID=UPI00371FD87D